MNLLNSPRRTERGGAGLALFLILLVAGAGAGWWFWQQSRQAEVQIDEELLVEVQRRDLMKAVLATGRVEPNARVNVMSRASGILKEIYVDEGDLVQVGQILAELDREQLVAQHNENLGNQAAAAARLKAARARLAEAQVKLDDPELEFARSQAKRAQELFDDGTFSQTELDEPLLRLKMVEYRIRQTTANIFVLEAGVAQAEADLMSSDAAMERSATALREATIRSPIDGVVLLRDKDVGDGISSILTAGGNATPVLTLGDVSSMFIEARVDEVDVGKIHDDMRSVIEVDAFKGHRFEGRVIRIAPAGTVDNNGIVTFLVKITVKDPDGLLRVDMTANTRLVLEDRPGALALPHKALTRDQKGNWFASRVVSQEPPSIESIAIKIGVSDGLMTEILEGLSEGDEIMLPGNQQRTPG